MPDLYEIVRAGDRAPRGAYAVHHLQLGDALDCGGITLTLQRDTQADGSEQRLLLAVEHGGVRALIDATTPLSFRSTCGVLVIPRAVGLLGGVRVELVLEARSVDAAAVMPRRVAA